MPSPSGSYGAQSCVPAFGSPSSCPYVIGLPGKIQATLQLPLKACGLCCLVYKLARKPFRSNNPFLLCLEKKSEGSRIVGKSFQIDIQHIGYEIFYIFHLWFARISWASLFFSFIGKSNNISTNSKFYQVS